MSQPIAIDYATPATLRPPLEDWRAASVGLSAIASGVGIAIVAVLAATGRDAVALAGLIWMLIGGMLLLIALVHGGVYAFASLRRGFPAPATPSQACLAILCPIGASGVGVGCVAAGAWLADRYGMLGIGC